MCFSHTSSSEVTAFSRNGICLGHTALPISSRITKDQAVDSQWGVGKYVDTCEKGNFCVGGEGWGQGQSLCTALKSVNNLVCSTAPRGVKVWKWEYLLRVGSHVVSWIQHAHEALSALCSEWCYRFVNLILKLN